MLWGGKWGTSKRQCSALPESCVGVFCFLFLFRSLERSRSRESNFFFFLGNGGGVNPGVLDRDRFRECYLNRHGKAGTAVNVIMSVSHTHAHTQQLGKARRQKLTATSKLSFPSRLQLSKQRQGRQEMVSATRGRLIHKQSSQRLRWVS